MNAIDVTLADQEVLLERLLEDGVAIAHQCGGALACAECSVVIVKGAESVCAASEDELDMLERGGRASPGVRLACQVIGAAELVVEIPVSEPPQHDSQLPVTLTERAARFLSRQLTAHPGALAVRLAVEPSGCSGLGYRVDPAFALEADDKVFEAHDVRIAISAASLPFVQGTRIDLVKEGLAQRLRYDNPNMRQGCGCGGSFGV